MKTRPEGAEFFHAERRTDMTKITVAFRNFEKMPKNGRLRYISLHSQFCKMNCY